MRLFRGMFLALSLLLAPLTGCGSQSPDEQAGDPTPTPAVTSTAPTRPPTNGPVDFDHVAVVAESAVGGVANQTAVDLSDPAALVGFLRQFENGRMAAALEQTIAEAEVAEGQTLVGAVVALSCVPPKAVYVEHTDAGLEITAMPDKGSDAQTECLVPVTSVGVVAVDSSLV